MTKDLTVRYADLLPLVLGGDIGVYAIGRSFHQAFNVKSVCINSGPIDAIARSSIFSTELIGPHMSDREQIAVINGVAAAHPNKRPVLMANGDSQARMIAAHATDLDPRIAVPFPLLDVLDRVTDKAQFATICEELGIATPGTVVVDCSAGVPDPLIPFDFPVVAKAARGSAYDRLSFPGKRKIWFMQTPQELTSLWRTLHQAGYRDQFLVQELIPGDNTFMRSITAYVDSHGDVSLIGSARVLLEDHAPTMIGNPVSMITTPLPDLWQSAVTFLQATGYRGFANFDVKIDPRNGRAVFFEVNPRIGRNSWYMTAAGVNPMIPMVEDLVGGNPLPRRDLAEEVLYSLVPDRLLKHYLRDDALRSEVTALIRAGKRMNPLEYGAEHSVKRRGIVWAQKMNQYRKFKRFYPEPTDRSF